MRALLGIDEGSSAVKATLFDLELRELASVRRPTPARHPAAGRVEQEAEEILEAVVSAVAELLEREPSAEVLACGLDHQGESVLAWERDTGRALSPVIGWQDKRSQGFLEALSPGDGARVTELSGLPVDPYFSAGKVRWLLDQGLPDGAVIGTLDAFISDRLGGGLATDRSTASRMQLARLGAGEWDPELCAIFGVDPATLPPIRDSVDALGALRHARWRAELPLCAQLVDQQAALAGTGCVSPGRVKATFGTGVFVLGLVGARPPAHAAQVGLVPTVAWSEGGVPQYALDGGVFSAGALLEWLSGGLGLFESPAELVELAASVETSDGVRILPALSGLGSPWWQPGARAVVSGLTGATGRAQIARAAIESICHRVCDIVEVVGGSIPVTELRVDGGLTRSTLLTQLLADYAGLPVAVGAVDSTALGVAALAAVGAGILPSVDAIADFTEPREVVEPGSERYGERQAWRQFVLTAGSL